MTDDTSSVGIFNTLNGALPATRRALSRRSNRYAQPITFGAGLEQVTVLPPNRMPTALRKRLPIREFQGITPQYQPDRTIRYVGRGAPTWVGSSAIIAGPLSAHHSHRDRTLLYFCASLPERPSPSQRRRLTPDRLRWIAGSAATRPEKI